MSARPLLVLGRHAGTEVEQGGASPGTRFLFTSVEAALRRHFELLPVPPEFYCGDRRQALKIAVALLQKADACLLGLPPDPSHLDPLFLVRERLGVKTPFIYMALGEFPRGAWFYRHFHSWFRSSDLILFSSNADRAIHDRLVSASPAETIVMPFGVRTDHFKPMMRLRHVKRRQLGVEEDDVVVVYHGRTSAEKNVHELMGLAREMLTTFPHLRLWIIGPVPVREPLSMLYRELLEDRALSAKTTLWGYVQPEVLPGFLACADIAVTLTLNHDENFGFGVVEAMASGLPVVGTDWGGLKDTIEEGVTGFKIRTCISPTGAAFDRLEARERLQALLSDKSLRFRMGRAGRQRAVERYELAHVAKSLSEQIAGRIGKQDTRSTEHRWTNVGRRLCKTFVMHDGSDSGRIVAAPVPRTTMLLRDSKTMHRLMEEYATLQCRSRRWDRLMLATSFFTVEGNHARSRDPRYEFDGAEVTALEALLLDRLACDSYADLPSLERHFANSHSKESVRTAVRALRGAGMIVSFGRAEAGVLTG